MRFHFAHITFPQEPGLAYATGRQDPIAVNGLALLGLDARAPPQQAESRQDLKDVELLLRHRQGMEGADVQGARLAIARPAPAPG
jgi:hypothetical protein